MLVVPTTIAPSFFLENFMNGKPIPRNENGLIELACLDCGKMRYSKHGWPRNRCTSCGKRHRFKSQPAVGLKTIDNIDQVIKEYQSGQSLKTLGKQYGVSAMTIRAKILDSGATTKTYSQAAIQREQQHGTVSNAHDRVREMCRTGEFQRNRSAMLQGIPVEEWKCFVTPKNKRLVASPEYKKWQKSVFQRDNHTCQLCGKTKCPIAAHHIYMKAKYPGRTLDTDNGITLCDKCHHKTISHEDEYIDLFVSLLNLLAQQPVW